MSVLAAFPEVYPSVKIPEVVRIGGSTRTYQQIVEIFSAERKKGVGFGKGDGYQIHEIDYKSYKEELKELVQKGEETGLLRHIL